ncbi:MAG: hypothetical protein Q9M23_04215, partial [Mariprofundaceae bacterium]|nr:hypothetical protein [Mariprofundaceae bacterium]
MLGGAFSGRPTNGDVDSAGNLLLIGHDQVNVNGSSFGQPAGAYWLFMDKTGAIQWQRSPGQALPTTLSGIEPDFVPVGIQSAGQATTANGLLGVGAIAFGPQDNLYITGQQNATFASGGATFQATKGYAAKYNLTTGKQWKAIVGLSVAPLQPEPGGNDVQDTFLTPEVDGLGNVYMGSGIYVDANFTWHRFIERNPQNIPELKVSVNSGLSAQNLKAGSSANAALLTNIKVLSLNMQAIAGDYTVDSLTISSRGNGDEKKDIATVRLKVGTTTIQTLPGSSFVAGATSASAYTMTFSGLIRTLAKGATETWDVEYD